MFPKTYFNRLIVGVLFFAANGAAAQEARVTVQADYVRYGERQIYARGNVRADSDGAAVCAKRLQYDREEKMIRAQGEVSLKGLTDYSISGKEIVYSPATKQGEMHDFSMQLEESGLRAAGRRLQLDGKTATVDEMELSSCPKAKKDWRVVADSVTIDGDGKKISGKNIKFEIGGVPVFYLPFAVLDYGRKKRSGLLWANASYRSNEGLNIGLPYYFFLADNYDATVAPHWFGEHGWLLKNEFRYLTPRASGDIAADWTPFLSDSRGRIESENVFVADSLKLKLRVNRVTDDDYFRDFFSDKEKTALRHLPTAAQLAYDKNNFFARLSVEKFQTIDKRTTLNLNDGGDSSVIPAHDLLPQIALGYGRGDAQNDWRGEIEFTKFSANSTVQADGARWTATAAAAHEFNFNRWSLTPQAGFSARYYRLQKTNDGENPADNAKKEPKLFAPFARVDARGRREKIAFFGKPIFGAGARSQFRAAYIYAPHRAQKNIPTFDGELRQLSDDGIFHHNRFVGGDKVADANFAAYGWNLRWWDAGGRRERAFLSFAQRFYFRAPQVVLDDEKNPPKKGFGNLLADMRAVVSDTWKLEGVWEWNPDNQRSERLYFDARGNFSGGRLLRAGLLLEEEESLVFGASSPVGKHLEAAFFSRYLLGKRRFSEATLSLLMRDDCDCWQIYLQASDKISGPERRAFDFSVGVEFNGLGGLGSNGYKNVVSDLRD